MGKLQDAAERFNSALRRHDDEAAAAIVRAYLPAYERLATQLEELAALEEQGEREAALLARYNALVQQIGQELGQFAPHAASIITDAQRTAVSLAIQHGESLVRVALGRVPASVMLSFNQLPAGAVAYLVGTLTDGSPLTDIFAAFGAEAVDGARRALVTGLALGYGPEKIAHTLRQSLDGDLLRARTIARTEILRAYRESSRAQYVANRHLVAGWLWWSARDERTCPVCWALHGSRHSVDQPLSSHVCCRCTMLPVVRPWSELGIHSPRLRQPALTVPAGEAEFAKISERAQLAILGPTKYRAYAGGTITLADLVAHTYDARWGPGLRERTARELGLR